MTNAAQIAQRYIDSWNETDAARRASLLATLWTEDARYVDPMMAGEGRGQIDALIAGVHQRFPGLRFALTGRPDGYGDKVRFSWILGPEGGEGLVEGTDFGVVENGRLRAVTGFLDKVPG
ncbi:nuclear transport factor 2 family protein [Caulobacter sp. 1776]|uniref:nuclear transport factor 2 family protein n=1 Tax=Caulobacter sp. 1776 TaxID=3156420 RepID=UPI003396C478